MLRCTCGTAIRRWESRDVPKYCGTELRNRRARNSGEQLNEEGQAVDAVLCENFLRGCARCGPSIRMSPLSFFKDRVGVNRY